MAAKPELVECPAAAHHHRHHDDPGDGEAQRDQVDDGEVARHADPHHDQPARPDGDGDDRAKRAQQETRRHGATLTARHRDGAIREICPGLGDNHDGAERPDPMTQPSPDGYGHSAQEFGHLGGLVARLEPQVTERSGPVRAIGAR